MGVIVPAKAHLDQLAHFVDHWREGKISDQDLEVLIVRTKNHLARACWCAENVCCPVHEHVMPHKRCALR